MSGFTRSFRSKWEHPVFRNLNEAGVWAWLCDTAVWKKTKVRYNDRLIELERGQLVTSIRFIAKGFGLGEQVTRTLLQNLENEGMINTQTNTHGTIITICNYDKYQEPQHTGNTPTNTRVTHGQHTGNTNKKEGKEVKEDKEVIIYNIKFEEFWKEYPRRVGKGAAQKAYLAAIKKIDHEQLLQAVKRHASNLETKKENYRYCPHPATWLNQERWADEPVKQKRMLLT